MHSSALVSPEYAHAHQLSNYPYLIILSNYDILIHPHLHVTIIYQLVGYARAIIFSSACGWTIGGHTAARHTTTSLRVDTLFIV